MPPWGEGKLPSRASISPRNYVASIYEARPERPRDGAFPPLPSMVSVRFSTVFTRSPNGVIALADIIGDETYHKFFVEITNWDCTK